MQNSFERRLESAPTPPFCFGQLSVLRSTSDGFVVSHREDESLDQVRTYQHANDAVEIAKYDDAGNYRPLKTAPNLRHGWRLELATVEELRRALDYFYPGRLAVFAAWKRGDLKTTALRETLDRQTGMYRVATKISDSQINDLVADFCRSNGGCLRTILWKRNRNGVIASTKLAKEKFDPSYDQATAESRSTPAATASAAVPLLCQEACNLLVAQCRNVVKAKSSMADR